MRRYTTFFVTQQESILLKSVIGLYNSKTTIPWEFSESESAELVFIGSGYRSAHLPSVFYGQTIHGTATKQTVAAVSEDTFPNPAENVFHLPPPLRAVQILKILDHLESRGTNSPHQGEKTWNIAPDSMVKMLNWPLQSLLGKNIAYIRLAAISSRKTMTPGQLASASGRSLDECLQYMQLLVDSGCAQIMQEKNPVIGTPQNKPEKGKLLNIFSRIRHKLGIGSANRG